MSLAVKLTNNKTCDYITFTYETVGNGELNLTGKQ